MIRTLEEPVVTTASVRQTLSRSRVQDAGEDALSFAALLGLLLAGRRTIFRTGLGCALAGLIVALLLPPTYTAIASFVPPGATNPSSAAALMGQLSALGGGMSLLGGNKGQGDLYVGILKSHTIAARLVSRFDLRSVYKVKKQSQAERSLAQASLFQAGMKDPIVTISVTDRSPERARDLANEYLKELQSAAASLALTESSQRRSFYEQRLSKEKNDLADAEVALKVSQEKTGLVAPAGQMATEIVAVAQLHAQITDRQARLAAMLHDETEENPDVLRLHSEIGSLQARVAQLESGKEKDHFGGFSTAQVPALQLEYIRRARDVKYHEALFEIVGKQYEAARLDEAKDSPLQVLDRATTPDTKSGPHRAIITVLALILGLMGGAVWVLVQHMKQGSFNV